MYIFEKIKCQWFSGKIQRCHRWAPGSIPGWRIIHFAHLIFAHLTSPLPPRRRDTTYAQPPHASPETPARKTWLKKVLLITHGNYFEEFGTSQSSLPCPLMSCLYHPLRSPDQYYSDPLLHMIHCLAVCGLCCGWVAVLYLRVRKYDSNTQQLRKRP